MTPPPPLRLRPPPHGLRGTITLPGDKSIVHRALLLGGIARGRTVVENFSGGGDNRSTLEALRALGVEAREERGGRRVVLSSPGLDAFREPAGVLDCGNSGTTARLLCGMMAGRPFFAALTGDASLRSRPMRRVVEPLRAMGARIAGRSGGDRLPLAFLGSPGLRLAARRHVLAVPSAQLKSALLLAGLQARGVTEVTEPLPSRDHTERMLPAFGVTIGRDGTRVRLEGGQALRGTRVEAPGDLSSASFFLVAAALVPGSDVTVRGVGLNPTRTGILDVLRAMGADLEVRLAPPRSAGAEEPRGTVRVRARPLRGVEIPPEWVPRTIDEFPILAVAAAAARGITLVRGASELRVKETDRVAVMARQLRRLGGRVTPLPDGFRIVGSPEGRGLEGARVTSEGDHRVAMSLAVAGLVARGTTVVEDDGSIATSFPAFAETLWKLLGRRPPR